MFFDKQLEKLKSIPIEDSVRKQNSHVILADVVCLECGPVYLASKVEPDIHRLC